MNKYGRLVTGINYFMILLFLLAAVLQYNDIDSALWMVTYGVAAFFCIMWKWSPVSHYWYIAMGSICLVWTFSLLVFNFDQLSWDGMFDSIQMKNNSVEIIREAGGLLVITIWMLILAYVPPYGGGGGKEDEIEPLN